MKKVYAVSWKRPPSNYVKLNTNANVSQNRAYGDGLLRNSEGCLIFAFYKEFGEMDVLREESLSLLHGLRLCKEITKGSLLVEVDLSVWFIC